MFYTFIIFYFVIILSYLLSVRNFFLSKNVFFFIYSFNYFKFYNMSVILQTVDQFFEWSLPMDITHLQALLSIIFHSLDTYLLKVISQLGMDPPKDWFSLYIVTDANMKTACYVCCFYKLVSYPFLYWKCFMVLFIKRLLCNTLLINFLIKCLILIKKEKL